MNLCVNGVPIKDKYVLSNRDIIGMGRAEFRLIFEGEDQMIKLGGHQDQGKKGATRFFSS